MVPRSIISSRVTTPRYPELASTSTGSRNITDKSCLSRCLSRCAFGSLPFLGLGNSESFVWQRHLCNGKTTSSAYFALGTVSPSWPAHLRHKMRGHASHLATAFRSVRGFLHTLQNVQCRYLSRGVGRVASASEVLKVSLFCPVSTPGASRWAPGSNRSAEMLVESLTKLVHMVGFVGAATRTADDVRGTACC